MMKNLINSLPSQLLKWIKLSPMYLLALSLFSGTLLFARESFLDCFGLAKFSKQYRSWISIFFLLFSFLLLSHLSVAILNSVKRLYDKHKNISRLRKWLHHLTPKQKEILRSYLEGETRTQHFKIDDGDIRELKLAGILYLSTGIVDKGFYAKYSIDTWVWEYLIKHPELLEI